MMYTWSSDTVTVTVTKDASLWLHASPLSSKGFGMDENTIPPMSQKQCSIISFVSRAWVSTNESPGFRLIRGVD